MADLLVQSVYDGGNSLNVHYGLFPPVPSPEAMREYDVSLTDALRDAQMPEGWSILGSSGKGEGQRMDTVEGEGVCVLNGTSRYRNSYVGRDIRVFSVVCACT